MKYWNLWKNQIARDVKPIEENETGMLNTVFLNSNTHGQLSIQDLAGHTGYDIDMDCSLAVQAQIAASLWTELHTLDLTPSLEKPTTMLLMIACGKDGAVPSTSVESAFSAYGKSLAGATKQWLLLENGNHLPFTEPANRQRCLDAVVTFLRMLETE